MIYIIGIIITFFLSFVLLTKKDKSNADKILFIWLCVILAHLAMFALISSEEYIHFPYFLGIELPIPLLHGPLLFLYTTSLTNKRRVTVRDMVHFIPFAIALFFIMPFLFQSAAYKIMVYKNEGEAYSLLTTIIFFGIILSGIIYSVLSLRSLLQHKRIIENNYSYIEKINLQWLFRLIIGLFSIWIIVLFADDKIIFSSVVLYVFFIGYYGIKQVGIFTNQPPLIISTDSISTIPELPVEIFSDTTKYQKSSLSDDQIESIHIKLIQLMKEKKLHLTPELTLSMVSQELNVHPNTLSQVINSKEQKNFFDYINSLRVEEFIMRIAIPENQKYTLLSLAFECGFNSKTSFNRNFKNITGKSPTEYCKEIRIPAE